MARSRRAALPPVAPAPLRVPGVDALRGVAILAMVAYHFAFDLRLFGVIAADFENGAFWLAARTAIVSSFLLLVGVSLVLAELAGVPTRRFLQRVALIGACAVAVSVASYVVFPATFITFGILHFIAVASIIARPLAGRPQLALALGAAAILAGLAFSHPFFDTRATSWLGFTTHKPPTQDYVPLFPWLGVVLAGIALAHALAASAFAPLAPLARAPEWLRWMGRHGLAIYMVHQPLLLGALWLALAVLR